MHIDYIQNLKNKLKSKVDRLNSTNNLSIFQSYLRQFNDFLNSHSIFQGIINELISKEPEANKLAERVVKNREVIPINKENLNVATSYFVLKMCCESDNNEKPVEIGTHYSRESAGVETALKQFNSIFLNYLYDYLEWKLDEQRLILTFLLRYKQRSEWFNREELNQICEKRPSIKEKSLKENIYMYLHDQGIEFTLEETLPGAGIIDFIAKLPDGTPLLAEAKVFNLDKEDLKRGVNQLKWYMDRYNGFFGTLVIFKVCERDIDFKFKSLVPFTHMVYNNKIIFPLKIDIYPYKQPASTRKILKPMEITEEYILDP